MGKTLVIHDADFSANAVGKIPTKRFDELVSVTDSIVTTDVYLLKNTSPKWTLIFEGVLTQRKSVGNGFFFASRTANTNGAGLFLSVNSVDGGKYTLNYYDPNGGSSTDYAIHKAYDGLTHKIVVVRNGTSLSLYMDNLASKKVATIYTPSDDELVFGKSWSTSTTAIQPFSNIQCTIYDDALDESILF